MNLRPRINQSKGVPDEVEIALDSVRWIVVILILSDFYTLSNEAGYYASWAD